ncbi:DUF1641 domain-containing protein [Paenibacillus sp. R14(2021)]|uniref:DUF1641 domain-containing protein n=1 Tax=Paenibacillus sp. R14(2021) TaxID=2859228 RepID=UPI001C615032|nr:DUF1641 domain-containing protein [Paenibacillus sp. R14(2021)]
MLETTIQKQDDYELQAKRADFLDQLLKPEFQEALTALITNLPKTAELTVLLTKTYDLAARIAGDRVLIQDTLGGIKEVVKPIEKKVKHFASSAIEARERAEQDESTIGLFGMLRLLKDPELQRMLRFGQAYLDILSERRK